MIRKLSEILLKRKQFNSKAIDIKFSKKILVLCIRLEFGEYEEDLIKNITIQIKGRTNGDFFNFKSIKNDFYSGFCISKFEIPLDAINVDIIDGNAEEIWDIYLTMEVNHKFISTRVKDALSRNTREINLNDKATLNFYTTVKGNLSIRLHYSDINPYLTEVTNIDEYTFLIKGKIEGLNCKKLNNIHLVFESRDPGFTYVMDLNVKKNGAAIEFEKEVSLSDCSFNYSKNEYYLYIEVNYDNRLTNKSPIRAEEQIINNAVYITDKDVKYKLEFIINPKTKNVSIIFNNYVPKLEITSIFVYPEEIIFNGFVELSKNRLISGRYPVFVMKNDSTDLVKDELELDNNSFSYAMNIKTLIKKGLLTNGAWSLYLEIDELLLRFATRSDGIENKKSIVNFPQVKISNANGEIKVLKPYYTFYDEISLLVRNYIVNKKVDYIFFGRNYLEINGLLNIHQPNDQIEAHLKGFVRFRMPYGEKFERPLHLSLKRLENSQIQFVYKMTIEMDKLIKNKIYNYLNFDLLECNIQIGEEYSTFYINALPSLIINNMEKIVKKNKRLDALVSGFKLKLYYLMNIILPINTNVFVFQSTTGMNYSCNPRAIYEEMLNAGKKFKAVWVVNNVRSEIPGNPIIVQQNSLKYYYYMAVGKYFINNGNFPDFYVKRNKTIHVQTWHGTPLKKLGFDIDPKSPSYKENTSERLMKRIARWDYLVAPNEYTGNILKRAYRFNKTILNVGYPRNDIFYKSDEVKVRYIKATRAYFNIPDTKKVILYAPTWRDNEFHQGLANEPYDFKFDLNNFVRKFGEEYVILVRLHPREAVRCQIKEYEGVVFNASNFDDIKLLYLISDILITDYSSVMFDFANTRKPIVFFAYDIKRYSSSLRGFYFNLYEEAPGPIVTTEEELFEVLRQPNQILKNYQEQYHNFYEKFCSWEDGNAAKRIINSVFNNEGN